MASCSSCGFELDGDVAFCKQCGAPNHRPASSSAPPPEPAPVADVPPDDVPEYDPELTTALDAAPDPAPPAERRSRGRRLRPGTRAVTIGVGLLVLALLGGGTSLGWWLGSHRDLAPRSAAPSTKPGPTATPGTRTMPDLRGLALDDSRQILSDTGVAPSAITVTERPAAGEVGVVLSQDPVYGYDIGSAVSLVVSTAAVVPEIKGRPATEVISELQQLGAQVATVSTYLPGATTGEVASITPAVGTALPDRVQVTIATAPLELDLTEVESVDSGCSTTEDLALNGTTFPTGLTCSAYPGDDPTDQTYVVNRGAERVRGTLGVPDDDQASETVRLQVLADGKVVGTFDAAYGAPTPFSAKVSGALRITFRVTTSTPDGATAGLGSVVAVGDPATLTPLKQQ